ncbi:putative type IV conjugative transfer system protein TraL [Clostridiales bacterium oral taxon 876 str. F0540]|nr:putative type IV conjugative transfer system protein TraL [Clostridiales bacterium oral taxon 876 str. F0540]
MKKIDWNELKIFWSKIYKYVIFSFILYIVMAVVTHFIFKNYPEYTIKYVEKLASNKSNTRINICDNIFNDFFDIFLTNIFVCFIGIVIGFIPFIFPSLLLLANNGFMLGMITASKSIQSKNVLLLILYGFIPHGIFEISAITLSIGMGSYISMSLTYSFIKKKPRESYRIQIVQTFIFVIIPLLFVAALIETFVTSRLVLLIK